MLKRRLKIWASSLLKKILPPLYFRAGSYEDVIHVEVEQHEDDDSYEQEYEESLFNFWNSKMGIWGVLWKRELDKNRPS